MGSGARVALAAVGAWAGALALNRSLVRVRGDSMAPTLRSGDVVVTVPARLAGGLRRGAVVVVGDPREPTAARVKRVAGLSGDRLPVEVDPGGRLVAPPGHVVVLGDARDRSTDSRVFGPVPVTLVRRVVLARVLPTPALLR